MASATEVAVPCRGAFSPVCGQQGAELAAVLGQVDRVRRGPDHRDPRRGQRPGQPERGLPAELDDHPGDRPAGLLGVHHFQDVLQGQRLEVEPP